MSTGEEQEGVKSGGLVRRRRRRWSAAEKRRIVAESHEPGTSVSLVARRHDVNANQVFTWRRQFREKEPGALAGGIVPVRVAGEPACDASTGAGEEAGVPPATGRIEIVLAGGRRVIVDRAVDASALARVVAVLERR